MALDREHARLVVQLLGHIFPYAFHLAATAAGGGRRFVANLAPRQMGRQRLAPGLPLLARRSLGRCELFDLVADGLQVGIQRFVQQASLLGAVALALGGELQALEQRVFMSELVDEGLFVSHLHQQSAHHLAQLLCAEFCQGLLLHHHES